MLNGSGQNYLQVGLPDDSLEQNDTKLQAVTIGPSSLADLVLKVNRDDWYRINVPADKRIAITAVFNHSYGDVDMELYRESEQVDYSFGTSGSEYVEHTNTAGDANYYVHLYLYDGVRNTYTLTTTAEDVFPRPPPPTLGDPGSALPPGQTISTKTPTFTWDRVPNSAWYELTIIEDPLGEAKTVYQTDGISGGSTSLTLPGGYLFEGRSYGWNMRAHSGGGWSDRSDNLYFRIASPVPTLTSMSPSSATAGGPAFTLTVHGTGYVEGVSVVRWNASNRTTTFVSSTQLTAAITASDIASPMTLPVVVFTRTPGGGTSDSLTFTIEPSGATLSTLGITPAAVTGGTSTTGTVTLSGPAPAGGAFVDVWSDHEAVQVPSSVTVPAGATSATFPVIASPVTSQVIAPVSANYNGTLRSATVTVNPAPPPTVIGLTFIPSPVDGGNFSQGTVTLSGAAPSGGAVVSLSSNHSAVQVPASVTVPEGATSATFTANTSAVTSQVTATVTATYNSTSQTATLTVNPPPLPTVSTLTLTPATVTGGTSSTGTVTLSGAALSGGAVVSLSSNNSVVQVPASVTVLGGATFATFTATTSSVTSQVTATVTATYNATSRSATLIVNPGPIASLSPASLNFGSQLKGTTSAPLTETVTNTGTATLTISSVNVVGANAGDFAKASDGCSGANVSPGNSCAISVTFRPTATELRTATLSISDNASGSPHTVALSGTGTGTGPGVSLAPPSLSFGNQLVGTTSTSQTVTLTNSGTATLNISGVTLNSTNGAGFSRTNHCAATLGAGLSCTIDVTFTPIAAGSRTATLSISSDAPGSPHTVSLTGTGTDFSLGVSSGSSTSATVNAGQTATFNLQLAPTGFSGNVSLTCTENISAATCSVLPTSVTLDGTNAAPFTVTVTTTARAMAGPRPDGRPGARGRRLFLPLVVSLFGLAVFATFAAPRRRRVYVGLAASLVLITLWASCGGGGGGGAAPPQTGTPAGTYSLTVAATASGVSRTTTLSLKVN